jgi:hypothetical protein
MTISTSRSAVSEAIYRTLVEPLRTASSKKGYSVLDAADSSGGLPKD